jgi:hypothetical protein
MADDGNDGLFLILIGAHCLLSMHMKIRLAEAVQCISLDTTGYIDAPKSDIWQMFDRSDTRGQIGQGQYSQPCSARSSQQIGYNF